MVGNCKTVMCFCFPSFAWTCIFLLNSILDWTWFLSGSTVLTGIIVIWGFLVTEKESLKTTACCNFSHRRKSMNYFLKHFLTCLSTAFLNCPNVCEFWIWMQVTTQGFFNPLTVSHYFSAEQNCPSVRVASMSFTVGVSVKKRHGPYIRRSALIYGELLHGLFQMLPGYWLA